MQTYSICIKMYLKKKKRKNKKGVHLKRPTLGGSWGALCGHGLTKIFSKIFSILVQHLKAAGALAYHLLQDSPI